MVKTLQTYLLKKKDKKQKGPGWGPVLLKAHNCLPLPKLDTV